MAYDLLHNDIAARDRLAVASRAYAPTDPMLQVMETRSPDGRRRKTHVRPDPLEPSAAVDALWPRLPPGDGLAPQPPVEPAAFSDRKRTEDELDLDSQVPLIPLDVTPPADLIGPSFKLEDTLIDLVQFLFDRPNPFRGLAPDHVTYSFIRSRFSAAERRQIRPARKRDLAPGQKRQYSHLRPKDVVGTYISHKALFPAGCGITRAGTTILRHGRPWIRSFIQVQPDVLCRQSLDCRFGEYSLRDLVRAVNGLGTSGLTYQLALVSAVFCYAAQLAEEDFLAVTGSAEVCPTIGRLEIYNPIEGRGTEVVDFYRPAIPSMFPGATDFKHKADSGYGIRCQIERNHRMALYSKCGRARIEFAFGLGHRLCRDLLRLMEAGQWEQLAPLASNAVRPWFAATWKAQMRARFAAPNASNVFWYRSRQAVESRSDRSQSRGPQLETRRAVLRVLIALSDGRVLDDREASRIGSRTVLERLEDAGLIVWFRWGRLRRRKFVRMAAPLDWWGTRPRVEFFAELRLLYFPKTRSARRAA